MSHRIVVGITGASGAPYAARVIELLADREVDIHLAITPLGRRLLNEELGMKQIDADALTNGRGNLVTVHHDRDVGASIASGSFVHHGMIIVPCSSNTMAALATGVTLNLVHRAAMVALKERRRLVIGHREMPLNTIDLDNMVRLDRAGAIIAPLNPGFYHQPQTIGDLVDHVAGRLVDLVGVGHDLDIRWNGSPPLHADNVQDPLD